MRTGDELEYIVTEFVTPTSQNAYILVSIQSCKFTIDEEIAGEEEENKEWWLTLSQGIASRWKARTAIRTTQTKTNNKLRHQRETEQVSKWWVCPAWLGLPCPHLRKIELEVGLDLVVSAQDEDAAALETRTTLQTTNRNATAVVKSQYIYYNFSIKTVLCFVWAN